MKPVLTIAIATFLLSGQVHAGDMKPAATSAAETAQTASKLPQTTEIELSDGVSILRQHGKRFEKAIHLIEQARAKPAWGWEDSCNHENVQQASSVNW